MPPAKDEGRAAADRATPKETSSKLHHIAPGAGAAINLRVRLSAVSSADLTRRYPMPLGFEVEFAVGVADTGEPPVIAEWEPGLPGRFDRRRLMDSDRTARYQFLTDLSEQIGAGVVCLEV